jgi:hypothetical protein
MLDYICDFLIIITFQTKVLGVLKETVGFERRGFTCGFEDERVSLIRRVGSRCGEFSGLVPGSRG